MDTGVSFPRVKQLGHELKHLMLRLGMHEAIPPLPYMSSWHGD